ncbi:MAG: hypothetical protein OXO48_17445 [Caldilineaceae bacterium]|nr:hypothetical protein [Caldilineaceae bacterium]
MTGVTSAGTGMIYSMTGITSPKPWQQQSGLSAARKAKTTDPMTKSDEDSQIPEQMVLKCATLVSAAKTGQGNERRDSVSQE